MKPKFCKALSVAACIVILGFQAVAQEDNKEKLKELLEVKESREHNQNEEIIIKPKGNKDTKVTVEIKGGKVTVNGKALSEFNDDNVIIMKRKNSGDNNLFETRSPFRSSTWNFNGNMNNEDSKKAFLGVLSEKDQNGAKVTRVTKGSAADKAGLKEGDVIKQVGDVKITGPEDLTRAIGKLKADDKTTVTIQRDNTEQKITATMGKRSMATTIFPENFSFERDFNFESIPPAERLEMLRSGNVRLGIRAQDTEEGKGAKVLNVDDQSNAEKAGIKEGDIITEFDGKAVNSATELAEAAKAAKDKSSIKVKYSRDGKKQEAEVKVPKKLKTANL